jgi:hypothetical protein
MGDPFAEAKDWWLRRAMMHSDRPVATQWVEINRDGEVQMGEAPVRGYLEMLQIAGAVIGAVNAVLKEYGVTEAEAAAIGKQLAKLAGQLR